MVVAFDDEKKTALLSLRQTEILRRLQSVTLDPKLEQYKPKGWWVFLSYPSSLLSLVSRLLSLFTLHSVALPPSITSLDIPLTPLTLAPPSPHSIPNMDDTCSNPPLVVHSLDLLEISSMLNGTCDFDDKSSDLTYCLMNCQSH